LGWVGSTTNQNNSLLQHAWFQQKMLMPWKFDPKDDQRYGMVEAISHLVHRDYAEIGHLLGTHGMDGGFTNLTNGNESMKIRY